MLLNFIYKASFVQWNSPEPTNKPSGWNGGNGEKLSSASHNSKINLIEDVP